MRIRWQNAVSDKKTRKSDYYLINYVNETNNVALIEFD